MNTDVCTKFDGYMRRLCHGELVISWIVTLTDGTMVYGDYDRPGYEKCWFRLMGHCKKHDVLPAKIELYMFGAPHVVFFEDPEGLDGVSICRGVSRDQSVNGDFKDFQFLTVSLLRKECDYIDVKKFVWPHNEFEEAQTVRLVTKKNIENMIFKNDSEKRRQPEVQKFI